MANDSKFVQKPVRMTMQHAVHLYQMAERLHTSDDELIGKAMELLFAAEALLRFDSDQESGGTDTAPLPEDEVLRELVETGVLDKHGWQRAPMVAESEFLPIEIQGKPLSETIIEERR